jgi:hypothetical protein
MNINIDEAIVAIKILFIPRSFSHNDVRMKVGEGQTKRNGRRVVCG